MKKLVLIIVLLQLVSFTSQSGSWLKSSGWPADGSGIVIRTMVRVSADLYLAAGNNYSSNGTVLYKSTDKGVSWTKISHNLISACSVYHLLADGNTLYAGTNLRLYKSTDFGVSWKSVNLPSVSKGLLKSGNTIYFASDNGMFSSTDGFDTWTKLNIFNGIVSDSGTSAIAEMNGQIFTATTEGPWVLDNSVWKPSGNIANTRNFHISKMVYVLGRYYLITFGNSFYSSTDALNWEKFDTPFTAHNIYALSDRVLFSLNTGGFFQCRDGGTGMVAFFNSGLKPATLYNSIFEFDGQMLLGGYSETGGSGIYRRALSDMNIPVGIATSMANQGVQVYPNPCVDRLYISNLELYSTIRIIDLQGRLLIERRVDAPEMDLDVQSLKSGIYLGEMISVKKKETFRFVRN